jgi:hypothetical protein
LSFTVSTVRQALVSVVIALIGVAGVIACGWALQAAALPPPKPAARVAADASVWFHEYRLAVDVFHFDHQRSEGACVRSWFLRGNGAKVHSSILSFRSGPILRLSDSRRVSVIMSRREKRFPPGLLAAGAGCSRTLARTLAAAAQGVGHISTERSYAANRPAIALELQLGREKRMTLFVSPRTYRPLVAFVDLDARKITARIYLQRVTRAVLARFGLLHRIKPEPKR